MTIEWGSGKKKDTVICKICHEPKVKGKKCDCQKEEEKS